MFHVKQGVGMIYFDNAATSWPKPPETKNEIIRVMESYGANPGRGAYPFAKDTLDYMEGARAEIANFLEIKPADHLIFTGGNTESANVVLRSLLETGDHLVYTSLEHNATGRPIHLLEKQGIQTTMIPISGDEEKDLIAIEKSIRKNTKLFVINHGSNVLGYLEPLEKIIALAKRYNILVFADMAQTAGIIPFFAAASGIDFIAYAGHKSLLGYGGIGLLYIREPQRLKPFIYGGTGTLSHLIDQPSIVPTGFEAGTRNLIGIGSLLGGIRYIKKRSIEDICNHELALTDKFLKGLKELPHIRVYLLNSKTELPVVSLNIKNMDPGKVALALAEKKDICVRAGLHCAPFAHDTIGTKAYGTVRFSFGPFNKKEEVDEALNVLESIKP